MRVEISAARTVLVFALGGVAGTQTALFLFDLYDDGVAEPLSGLLGLVFILIGLAVALWPYLRQR